MPCFYPMEAFYGERKSNGRYRIVFNERDSEHGHSLRLPCGGCPGCRLERSRQWAIRCVHEAQLHERNCFITLTFSPEALAERSNPVSLDVRDFQLFMKRFRKRFGNGIRFFHCGEYGELRGRPHYHAIIFNFDFDDRVLFKVHKGVNLYVSKSLSDLWPFGFASVGDVTFDSAAYVARYIMKKVNGKKVDELVPHFDPINEDVYFLKHYEAFDSSTGEIIPKKPEYTTMSRRPGIAAKWFKEFKSDVFPSDEVVIRGRKMRPPKYYDSLYERDSPEDYAIIKDLRSEKALIHSAECTPERLRDREKVLLAKLKSSARVLE